MKHLWTLVIMQLKDKLNISVLKSFKELARFILFIALKFIVVTLVTFFLLFFGQKIGLFYYSESSRIMILVITISLTLSLISCTKDLMMSLYFSDDNKVLITLPVDTNILFTSKLIVFYIYEIKRSLGFLIPICLGCLIQLFTRGMVSWTVFLWAWIPMLLIVALPVLLGAVLSIPSMYVYRFIKKTRITQIILFVLVLAGFIFVSVTLIGLIPDNINLLQDWNKISNWIRDFLLNVEKVLYPTKQLVHVLIGEHTGEAAPFFLNWVSLIKFAILIGVDATLLALTFFLSRPLFFGMMAKNFEVNKDAVMTHKNRHHGKYFTFVNKEFKINLRTLSISVNYLMVYIITPILVLLLNALYKAMETNYRGDVLKCTFNVLIMCLPMLASNAMVATYYSREGRAGYLKRTKPIDALYPLFAKLVFNALFAIPSIIVSAFIFGKTVGFSTGYCLLIGCGILFIHLGHMIWSATLDIMNPMNEQYATTGVTIDNPNENKSTMLAFIVSFAYAFLAFFFFNEAGKGASNLVANDFGSGVVRIALIGLLFMASLIYLFIAKVRAYYYDFERR